MSKPAKDEESLLAVARDAFIEMAGREPTRQELWRIHSGFKRMAFTVLEHLDHIQKHENENPHQTTYSEDIKSNEPAAPNTSRTLGKKGKYIA